MLVSELFCAVWQKISVESGASNMELVDHITNERGEQEIAEACNRLIKNSIICWNYHYLAHQLEKANNEDERENLRQIIMRHSPMTWVHINMLGEYDFSDEKLKDSIVIHL
ncbi:Tn3 family transposase [Nitrosomonas aestuarii]|uniref:Tn3 family transposase n=1 Tax=Nitrosomonas aestuarii TaxID=52441 RepID=UPI000D313606|nr:Tn3 family transposase [Nitrosomonas aestuarii]PTN10761.1 Tn3 transposase DDE domain-containing protein [Nitrosomonas aestuarii]